MEDVYVNQQLSSQQIKATLTRLFPALDIFYWDCMYDKLPAFNKNNPADVFFTTHLNQEKLEFAFNISMWRTPEQFVEERALYIGQQIAIEYQVKVLVPFTNPEDSSNPYYDIIFENGKVYLADDFNTNFADDTKELIKIIREYSLPQFTFDALGKLIKP